MNKVYKIVWNASLGAWIAVSELAKGKTKKAQKTATTISATASILGAITLSTMASAGYEAASASSTNLNCSISMMGNPPTKSLNSIAISGTALGTSGQVVACAPTADSIAIGSGATTKPIESKNISIYAQSIAIGAKTQASGDQSIALGANTKALGNSSVAIGGDDLNSVAHTGTPGNHQGKENDVFNDTVVAKEFHNLTGQYLVNTKNREQYISTQAGDASVAVGVMSSAEGALSLAFGTRSKASKVATTALGTGAVADKDGAVALGAGSVTKSDATQVDEAEVNNVMFGGFAGKITGEGSQVSVGSDGYERQVKNVAAGAITKISTDAINGSQLFAVVDTLIDTGIVVGANSIKTVTGDAPTHQLGKQLNIVAGDLIDTAFVGENLSTEVKQDVDGKTTVAVGMKKEVNFDKLTVGNVVTDSTTNKITGLEAGDVSKTSKEAVNGSQLFETNQNVTTAQNAADAAQAAADAGWNVTGSGEDTANIGPNGKLDVVGDNNISVEQTGTDQDAQLAITLSKDLKVDSLTAGNSVVTTEGLSVKNAAGTATTQLTGNGLSFVNASNKATGPSITAGGINAGDLKVTNVAAGTIAADSKEAVNGSQLYNAQNNVANVIGGETKIDPNTGNLTTSNIGGTGADNIHDAIKSVNQIANNANQGWNVSTNGRVVTNVKPNATVDFSNTDGNVSINNDGSNISVNLNKDQNLGKDGSLSIGDSKLDNNGLTIVGGPSVTATGIDAGNKQVTNVADGKITSGSQDAVNGSQIHDMMGAGAYDVQGNLSNIGGTGASNIHDAFSSVNQKITDSKVSVQAGSSNVSVTSNSSDTVYTVDISKDLNVNSVTAKDLKADTITAGNTTINSNGLSIKNGPSITSLGVDAGNKVVTGVANGSVSAASTEAVNGSQLDASNQAITQYLGGGSGYNNITQSFDAPTYEVNGGAYNNVGDALGALNQADQALDNRITNLGDQLQQAFYSTNQRIDDIEKKANAGIAAAMALEAAPYIAGKYTYAAGAAYHGGENAVGVTLRKTADNGRWSLTGGVASGSAGDPSIRIGISGVIN